MQLTRRELYISKIIRFIDVPIIDFNQINIVLQDNQTHHLKYKSSVLRLLKNRRKISNAKYITTRAKFNKQCI